MHIPTIQDTGRTIFKTASGAWRYPTATCTKVNESRHICTNCVTLHLHCVLANGHVYEGEWVMSHVWVSSDICTSHVALHVCCWRRWMSHVSHMYEACHTAHVTCASQRWHVWRWMSIGPHISHMYESCHSDLWQTSLWKFSDISVTWQIYRYHSYVQCDMTRIFVRQDSFTFYVCIYVDTSESGPDIFPIYTYVYMYTHWKVALSNIYVCIYVDTLKSGPDIFPIYIYVYM